MPYAKNMRSATSRHFRDAEFLFEDRLVKRRAYDAVLIDARAGLTEIAAGALFALGASTMIFGVNQAQTFEDLRFLFAHLARMPHSSDPELDSVSAGGFRSTMEGRLDGAENPGPGKSGEAPYSFGIRIFCPLSTR
jgi:hypothetical protein